MGRDNESGMLFAAIVNVELLLCHVVPERCLAYLGCLSHYTKHQECDITLHQCFDVVLCSACVDELESVLIIIIIIIIIIVLMHISCHT